MCRMSWKSGSLKLLEPSGQHRACYGTALTLLVDINAFLKLCDCVHALNANIIVNSDWYLRCSIISKELLVILFSDSSLQLYRHACGVCLFFGAFEKIRRAPITFVMSNLSVRPSAWNNSITLNRFSWDLMLKYFSNVCLENLSFIKILDKNNRYCTWRPIYRIFLNLIRTLFTVSEG